LPGRLLGRDLVAVDVDPQQDGRERGVARIVAGLDQVAFDVPSSAGGVHMQFQSRVNEARQRAGRRAAAGALEVVPPLGRRDLQQ
jgi:hypothetical protein